jgi:polyisoprenoid-binding protein YceI
MKRLTTYTLVLFMAVTLLSVAAIADHHNPCNPCNPCAMKHFGIDDARNVFRFESKATLETITGTTSKITGHVNASLKDVTKDLKASFELDLTDIKTGIGLRDEHMRDNFLETGKYPKAELTIDKVTKASSKMLTDGKPVSVNADGTLKLHGVTRKIKLTDIQVTYLKGTEATKARLPGDLLHIDGSFTVKLSDYNIKRPQMVLLKLNEDIKITVDVFGTTATKMGNPCNPCGKKNPCNPCKKKNPCKK